MTRVSDNSGKHALNFAISKAKQRLEELQLQGSSLRKIGKPSDDPAANVQYMSIGSNISNKDQYLKSANLARMQLEYTENALVDLTEALNKAKELAITQSSDIYNDDIRKNVAREVEQLRSQTLAISNRRLGNRFIFGGYSTLERPFTEDGVYTGDTGRITLEVAKDFFIPINVHGIEVFYSNEKSETRNPDPLAPFPGLEIDKDTNLPKEVPERVIGGRDIAGIDPNQKQSSFSGIADDNHKGLKNRDNVFGILDTFVTALENGDPDTIQDILVKIDSALDRTIMIRTRLGALQNSVSNSESSIENSKITDQEQRSNLADADVAELYTDLAKQKSVLEATYKSGQSILSKSLIDFIR